MNLSIVREVIEIISLVATKFKPFHKPDTLTPIVSLDDISTAVDQVQANRMVIPQPIVFTNEQRREDKRLSRGSHKAEKVGPTSTSATKNVAPNVAKPAPGSLVKVAPNVSEPTLMKIDQRKIRDGNLPVGIACLPCTVSHMATVAGQLSEAIRFARVDLTDDEVIIRIDNAMKEIANVERIDLAPEKLVDLPEKERELANSAAVEIRDIRHGLEYYESADDLEKIAAQAAHLQHRVNKAWQKVRLDAVKSRRNSPHNQSGVAGELLLRAPEE